jgi:2-polyprenyl-3-methyl-5-hydroxy-6-metoxy-1,4-benzoquinol methylase
MRPLPPALTSLADPLVYVNGNGAREKLTVSAPGPGVSRIRVVVRAVDDARAENWYIVADADIPAKKARSSGVIQIMKRSVNITWSGSALQSRADQFRVPPMTTPSLLIVDLFGTADELVAQSVVEFRTIDSEDLLARVALYAEESQSGGEYGPLLSLTRFFGPLEAIRDMVVGRSVFVSGCGTGGELIVLASMGARSVVGSEVTGTALDLAIQLTEGNDRISVISTTEAESRQGTFDFALSRHVVEHLPVESRSAYVAHLVDSVREGGSILVEFPNQDCPVEPHTGLEFFHWLDPVQRHRAVEYFSLMAEQGAYSPERARLLASFGDHRNVSLDEFTALVPANAVLSSIKHFDSAFTTDHRAASTLECILTRTS